MTDTLDALELDAVLGDLTSAKQQVAVECLAAGGTQADAAEAAGVARETVNRWAGHDDDFRAALARYRASLAADQADLARRVRGKALDLVERHLDDGTATLADALAVVRATAAPVQTQPGPDTLPAGSVVVPADADVWSALQQFRRAAQVVDVTPEALL